MRSWSVIGLMRSSIQALQCMISMNVSKTLLTIFSRGWAKLLMKKILFHFGFFIAMCWIWIWNTSQERFERFDFIFNQYANQARPKPWLAVRIPSVTARKSRRGLDTTEIDDPAVFRGASLSDMLPPDCNSSSSSRPTSHEEREGLCDHRASLSPESVIDHLSRP